MKKEEKDILDLLHKIAETLETDKVCDDCMEIRLTPTKEGVIS